MQDLSWDLEEPSLSVLQALAVDCFDMNSHMPIEDICRILYRQYTYDEVRVMEAEFLLQALQRLVPGKEMDSLFIEKLYAIPAILNNPIVFTQSMTSFFNAVCLCNDIPAGTTDIHDVPSRYLPRTIHSINVMLPDEMDFNETYLYTNVKSYIFNMYRNDDCPVLDPCFSYLQREFNGAYTSISKRAYLDEFVDRVMTDCEKLYDLMDIFLKESESTEIIRGLSDSGFPVKYKMKYARLESEILKKYESSAYETVMVKNHLSNMLYNSLYSRMSAKLNVKSNVWIIGDLPGFKQEAVFTQSILYQKILKFLAEDTRNVVYLLVPEEISYIDAIDRVHTLVTSKEEYEEQIRTICGEHTPPDNIRISSISAGDSEKLSGLGSEYKNAGSTFQITT